MYSTLYYAGNVAIYKCCLYRVVYLNTLLLKLNQVVP